MALYVSGLTPADLKFECNICVSELLARTCHSLADDECNCTHGYNFWLEGRRSAGRATVDWYLNGKPDKGCESYHLLLDYSITAYQGSKEVCSVLYEFDLVTKDSHVTKNVLTSSDEANNAYCMRLKTADLNGTNEDDTVTLKLSIKVREILSGKSENLHEAGLYRDFALLVQESAFYVNLHYLGEDLGSSYFKKLEESRQNGTKRTVLLNHTAAEMQLFFDSLCTYKRPVVSLRNFDVLLQLSSEFKIAKALRACEQYLLQSRTINPIRKLEYAAEFGFGLLGDSVIRSLGSSGLMALEAVHDYCNLNADYTVRYMHPDVLEALDIHEDFVII